MSNSNFIAICDAAIACPLYTVVHVAMQVIPVGLTDYCLRY